MMQEFERDAGPGKGPWRVIEGIWNGLADLCFEGLMRNESSIRQALTEHHLSIDDVMRRHVPRRLVCVDGILRAVRSTPGKVAWEITSPETGAKFRASSDCLIVETEKPVRIAGHVIHEADGFVFNVFEVLDADPGETG